VKGHAHPAGPDKAKQSCGMIGLLGRPNAGKSTLLNTLVGSKVSIVTHKVQTTRSRIIGICMQGNAQLVFVDTPGIVAPRRRLEQAMVEAAWRGARGADLVVVLIDAQGGFDDSTPLILKRLAGTEEIVVVAINKVDLVKKERLLDLAGELNSAFSLAGIFMISALTGDGVSDLREFLAAAVPAGPWLYPADQIADISQRFLAAEITREKLFLKLHQELPYATTVEPESWKELPDGSVRIEQLIYVLRANQKGIVLGKGGATIKAIGESARRDLEKVLDRRVHLILFVKARPGWLDEPERYREIGLEFPR